MSYKSYGRAKNSISLAEFEFVVFFYLSLYFAKRLTHIFDVCEVENYSFNVELVDRAVESAPVGLTPN